VPNEKVLLKRFLFHWLTTQSEKIHNISSGSGAQRNLSSVKMMKLKIPVPPLEVQCEIVHILDDFTLLSAALSAGHAALLLSGKYEVAGRAYKLDGEKMTKTTVDTKTLKNVLVTSYGLGGSYCAVIIKK